LHATLWLGLAYCQVRAISSGKPEVNDYAFTTRGLLLGHVVLGCSEIMCQVVDTPGMRSYRTIDGGLNSLELLTLASITHLEHAVIVFVFDASLTAGDGNFLRRQIELHRSLREQFAQRLWLDVQTKADVCSGTVPDEAHELLVAALPGDRLTISPHTGHNMELFRRRLHELLRKAHANMNPAPSQSVPAI
jgi:GTP1/Obg family GTP-binding protein